MIDRQQTFATEAEHRAWIAAQSALPVGFRVGTHRFDFTPVEIGKPATMTLSLVVCDEPTPDFAAVFTRNAFPGAPVRIGRQRLQSERLGAIIINNKVSNVCAPEGVATAETLCTDLAGRLGLPPAAVLPSSTGVIGWRIPLAEMQRALPDAVAALQADSIAPLASGIMTTDLYPKVRRYDFPGGGSIVGVAKGAGMVEPNLATMLSYLLTDVPVARAQLRACLAEVVETSYNAISIDTDQSTSDTVVALSSGQAQAVPLDAFKAGLRVVCEALAEDLVRNGEGVHHVVRATVSEAPDAAIAKGIGKAVINSPLLQCAICGNDPNVGRLVAAVGKWLGDVHPEVPTAGFRLAIGGIEVFADGCFHLDPDKERRLHEHLVAAELYRSTVPADGVYRPPVSWPPHQRYVDIGIACGCGTASCTVIGGDRSHEYISENADYRS